MGTKVFDNTYPILQDEVWEKYSELMSIFFCQAKYMTPSMEQPYTNGFSWWKVMFKDSARDTYTADTNDALLGRNTTIVENFYGPTALLFFDTMHIASYNYTGRMLWIQYGYDDHDFSVLLNCMMTDLFPVAGAEETGIVTFDTTKDLSAPFNRARCNVNFGRLSKPRYDETRTIYGKSILFYGIEGRTKTNILNLVPFNSATQTASVYSMPDYIDGGDAGLW